MGHKRGHKPPTANPKIVDVRRETRAGGSLRPSGGPGGVQAQGGAKPASEPTKRELYAMLANAVRNTG